MADVQRISGDLQTQIMAAMWQLERGTVEDVRSALPPRYRSAYNTVQTVLNRLVERRLLTRERRGAAYQYQPRISESEYLSGSIASTLAGASSEARQVVLAQLVGDLNHDELERLQQLAKEIGGRRRRR